MNALSYIFTPIPGSYFRYYTPLLIIAGIIFIGSFIGKRLVAKNKALKKTLGGTLKYSMWLGLGLALLVAFRYERIPYFSMRFLLFALLAGLAFTIGRGIYLYVKNYKKVLHKINKPKAKKATYSASKK